MDVIALILVNTANNYTFWPNVNLQHNEAPYFILAKHQYMNTNIITSIYIHLKARKYMKEKNCMLFNEVL